MRGWKTSWSFCTAAALAASAVGCTAVPSMSEVWFGPSEPTPEMKAEAERIASLPTYTLLTRYDGYKPESKEIPLEDVVFVQDAIDKSGVKGNMGRMKILLVRQLPGKHEPLKFQCDYDAKKKMVSVTENYQVKPGDKLYLSEDPSTPMDDIVNSIFPGGEKMPSVWTAE
jgi:hypothetical protein